MVVTGAGTERHAALERLFRLGQDCACRAYPGACLAREELVIAGMFDACPAHTYVRLARLSRPLCGT